MDDWRPTSGTLSPLAHCYAAASQVASSSERTRLQDVQWQSHPLMRSIRMVLVMAMFQNVDLQLHGLDLVVVLGHHVLKVTDVRRGWWE